MKQRQKSLRKRKVVEKWYRLSAEIFHATNNLEVINQKLKGLIDSAQQREEALRELCAETHKIDNQRRTDENL